MWSLVTAPHLAQAIQERHEQGCGETRVGVPSLCKYNQLRNSLECAGHCADSHVGKAGDAVREAFKHGHDGAVDLDYGLQSTQTAVTGVVRANHMTLYVGT